MPTANLSTGVDLYYEWHGSAAGPPVVFVRGTAADGSRWLPQVEEYQHRYRCLIFDIPDAELVVFPGGSHLFGMQDPGTFNRVTLDWLARQHGPAAAGTGG